MDEGDEAVAGSPIHGWASTFNVGVILSITGVAVFAASNLYFSLTNQLGISPGALLASRVRFAVYAAVAVLGGLGFFLIFTGLLHLTGFRRRWADAGRFLILGAGLSSALLSLLTLVLLEGFSTSPLAFAEWARVSNAIGAVVGAASSLGILLALVGVARGLLARRSGDVPGRA